MVTPCAILQCFVLGISAWLAGSLSPPTLAHCLLCSELPEAATVLYANIACALSVMLPADADIQCTQALEHGVDAADSSEEDEGEPGEPTYVQEQQDLKRNFLQVRNNLLQVSKVKTKLQSNAKESTMK